MVEEENKVEVADPSQEEVAQEEVLTQEDAPVEENAASQETPVLEKTAPIEASEETKKQGEYEHHASTVSARPGDRKYGKHTGKPSERRGGRSSFRSKVEEEYLEKVVQISRISKTVTGGKHIRFSALVVVGDGKGHYGFAQAKSGEVPDAIKKALTKAKKTMYKVQLAKGGTLTHDIDGRYEATKVVLKAAKPGTGIVAGGAVRAVLELAGFTNVVSKVYGSRTKVNVVHATHLALQSEKHYDDVMVLRGLKTPEEIANKHHKHHNEEEEE